MLQKVSNSLKSSMLTLNFLHCWLWGQVFIRKYLQTKNIVLTASVMHVDLSTFQMQSEVPTQAFATLIDNDCPLYSFKTIVDCLTQKGNSMKAEAQNNWPEIWILCSTTLNLKFWSGIRSSVTWNLNLSLIMELEAQSKLYLVLTLNLNWILK